MQGMMVVILPRTPPIQIGRFGCGFASASFSTFFPQRMQKPQKRHLANPVQWLQQLLRQKG
ncbi:MAG: hypothetical protein EBZ48_09630 [Proteobacteria bacterium]|nr:hypothetical protein [Pseudomonadota bacterium]